MGGLRFLIRPSQYADMAFLVQSTITTLVIDLSQPSPIEFSTFKPDLSV